MTLPRPHRGGEDTGTRISLAILLPADMKQGRVSDSEIPLNSDEKNSPVLHGSVDLRFFSSLDSLRD